VLVIFSGLPGVGKTAIARELARRTGAVYLRIDSVERAIQARTPGLPLEDRGYRVAYAVAEDNLRIGRTVVADSVNPIDLTREAWLDVARRTGAPALEVEILCSDADEHRRRVESRAADIPGMTLPTWNDVVAREYHPWRREHLTIDTAIASVDRSVATIEAALTAVLTRASRP
jgi:predicted kinase